MGLEVLAVCVIGYTCGYGGIWGGNGCGNGLWFQHIAVQDSLKALRAVREREICGSVAGEDGVAVGQSSDIELDPFLTVLGIIPAVQAAFSILVRRDGKRMEIAAHIDVRAVAADGALGITGQQSHEGLGCRMLRGHAVQIEEGVALRDHEADAVPAVLPGGSPGGLVVGPGAAVGFVRTGCAAVG